MQRLREEGMTPLGFFYNPNIHPEEEHQRRLEVVDEIAHNLDFELIKGTYDRDHWFQLIKGLENEPEGGRRCLACFRMRLEQTYSKAKELNIAQFATTLTVSPHKNTVAINNIGKAAGPSRFLSCDFKKKDGFRLAIEIAQRYNLYRQNYCGCIYSKGT